MPWFNLTSLQGDSEALPDIVCNHDDCYLSTSHYDYTATSRGLLSFDAPCSHVLTHTAERGDRYVFANRLTQCACGCGGYVAYPYVTWEGRANFPNAYLVDHSTPMFLTELSAPCNRCRGIINHGTDECRRFEAPDSGNVTYFCDGCYGRSIAECEDCSDTHLRSNMEAINHRNNGRIFVCQSCYESWERCAHCNYYWNTEADDYCCGDSPDGNDAYADGCNCYTCRSTRATRDRVIRNYSYKPDPEFRYVGNERRIVRDQDGFSTDRTPYLGFELEVEVTDNFDRGSVAKRLQDAIGDVVYLKEDGSIEDGFEIVTHPMTLDYAMSKFNWAAIRTMRRDGEAESADNCGMHVHVSKAGFSSPAHEYRWLLFWHRNQVAMRALAGRDSSYAQYHDEQRSQFVPIVKKQVTYSERYSAINVNNPHTHEVRVFASTLYVNRLKASLQLVEATVEYTRHLASSKVMHDGGFAWHEFVQWLQGNARRYADLLERIRAVVKLTNVDPITTVTEGWGVSSRRDGRVDTWVNRKITIQEKVIL